MSKVSTADVLLYYPNLIGYARFAFLMISTYFAFSTTYWVLFPVFYGLAYLMDIADGMAARAFNQCSRYGAALDMICDRASNATMYMILSGLFPKQDFLFFGCLLLDFGSHWYQFQTTALMKAESHKGKNKDENFIIDLYYNNKLFFSTLVVGSETCTVFLYILGKVPFFQGNFLYLAVTFILCAIMSTKMLVNVFQWYGGLQRILSYDREHRGVKVY